LIAIINLGVSGMLLPIRDRRLNRQIKLWDTL